MWIGIYVVVVGSWDFSLLCLVVGNDLLTITVSINQSLLLQQFWNSVAICHHQVSCKQYDCLHVWHPWDQHAQVKAILAFISESLSRCFFFLSIISAPSMLSLQNLIMLGQETGILWILSYVHHTLLTLVWKYYLKWFIQMIDDYNLMGFVCFVLFCAAGKAIVLEDNLVPCTRKDILNANVTYKMIAIQKSWYTWQ